MSKCWVEPVGRQHLPSKHDFPVATWAAESLCRDEATDYRVRESLDSAEDHCRSSVEHEFGHGRAVPELWKWPKVKTNWNYGKCCFILPCFSLVDTTCSRRQCSICKRTIRPWFPGRWDAPRNELWQDDDLADVISCCSNRPGRCKPNCLKKKNGFYLLISDLIYLSNGLRMHLIWTIY